MKKMLVIMMLSCSAGLFAAENVVLDKEVTGINKETIETREIKDSGVKLETENVEGMRAKISDKNIKNEKQGVLNKDSDLQNELSGEVKKDTSFLKILLGVVGIVAIGIAL
ncbi:hypothetical protein [Fusobacterium sp. IOR10]|uniref:hypothetical protein n=1 Tax=Fusobacterium sp. IOR10 TaxID=2665157 RepID=UPI0013D197D6|nr:hypothetical protein [Fusobacterium sp. IOR10]